MRQLLSASACALFVILSQGCSDEQPDPTGDLERPSGLVVVPRSAEREDLLVADAEAQGLRVQQYYQSLTPDAQNRYPAAIQFVLSPTIYFPLIIPAEGFPTEVAVTNHGVRAYTSAALAPPRDPSTGAKLANQPTVGRLYVMDVREASSLPGRASDDTNTTLGAVELEGLAPGALPMDVAVLGSDPATPYGTDQVAVLTDRLNGTGALLILDVQTQASAPQLVPPASAVTVELGASPRSMTVVSTTTPALLVALAGEGDHVVQVDVQGGVAQATAVDVGGPVSRIIRVDDNRALALRVDTAAVIVLERPPGGVFVRSTRIFGTPFGVVDPFGAVVTEPGRIDLALTVVSGAMGWPKNGFPGVDDAEAIGIVMLTLLDGQGAFLRGDTLDLLVNEEAKVTRIRPTDPTETSTVSLRECETELVAWCLNEDTEVPECEGLVRRSQDVDSNYLASFRGLLLSTRSFLVDDVMEVRTSTAPADQVAMKFSFETFDLREHRIAAGDVVSLQVPQACGSAPGPWSAVGQVTAVDQALEVTFEPEALAPLPTEFKTCAWSEALLDVVPFGDEVVFQQSVGRTVDRVETRVPVTRGVGGQWVARIEQTPEGLPTSLAFTLAFGTELPSAGFESIGDRRCETSAECGVGRNCVQLPDDGLDACPRVCDEGCQADTVCNPGEQAWIGTGLEFSVAATSVQGVDLGTVSGETIGTREVINAVPYETVWMPVWQVWATSFPGSRSIVRVRASAGGLTVGVTR